MSGGYFARNGHEYPAQAYESTVFGTHLPMQNGQFVNQAAPMMMVPQYTTQYIQVPTIHTITEMVPMLLPQSAPPPLPPSPLLSPPIRPRTPPRKIRKERAAPVREKAAPPPPPPPPEEVTAFR